MAEILPPRALDSAANCSANGFQALCSTPAGLASKRMHSIEAKPSRRAQSSSSTPPRINTPTLMFFARSFPHRPLASNPANRSFMRQHTDARLEAAATGRQDGWPYDAGHLARDQSDGWHGMMRIGGARCAPPILIL